MKFSENWVREWVNPSISTEQLCDQITMLGLEVDGVEKVAGDFTGVVVGEVVECAQHPDADKLRVIKVNVGGERLLDIVCGAPNCRQGLKVACAIIALEGLGATRLISFLSCRIGRHSPTIASICGPSCPQLKSAEECD